MKVIGLVLLFLLHHIAIAQTVKEPAGVAFDLAVNGEPLELGKSYFLKANKDSVDFETLRFYISDLQLFAGEKLVAIANKRHLLIDAEQPASLSVDIALVGQSESLYADGASADPSLNLPLDTPFDFSGIDRVLFKLGVDSLVNVSGAFGGDLDPTKGMYWTWQSGYINFKLEGTAQNCPARNNRFQFHIGGYQHPFNSLQEIELALTPQHYPIITVELEKLLARIDLKDNYQIMSPNAETMEFVQLFPLIFSAKKFSPLESIHK